MDIEKKSKKFYAGLARIKPDWQDPENKLKDYIFVGSLTHPNSWKNNLRKVFNTELPYPSREEINGSRQMRDIRGVRGMYPSSNEEGNLLKLTCVCGTEILHSHFIADSTRNSCRGYVNSKLCVGSCCVKLFIDPTFNHKHCIDCESLDVKRKQVRCEACRVGRCQKCDIQVGKMRNGQYYKYCYGCYSS